MKKVFLMVMSHFLFCFFLSGMELPFFIDENAQAQEIKQEQAPLVLMFDNNIIQIKPETAKFSSVLKKYVATEGAVDQIDLKVLLGDVSLTHTEALALFSLLETIYVQLTPRVDGGYVAQQVQPLVDQICIGMSNEFLGRICKASYALDMPLLVNACCSTIISRASGEAKDGEIKLSRETVRSGEYYNNELETNDEIEKYQNYSLDITDADIASILTDRGFGKFSQERIVALLRKHYFLKVDYTYFRNKENTQELSIADYIHIYGQPRIENGEICFDPNQITSFYGIDQLDNKETISEICLRRSYLGFSCFDQEIPSLISFPALKCLNLGMSGLKAIPVNLLKGLHSLEDLFLSDNELTDLAPELFQDLSGLKTLYMEGGEYKTLPAKLFNGLAHLENLALDYLSQFHESAFSTLINLKTLRMTKGSGCLPGKLFKNLISLQELDLSDQLFKKIHPDSFYGLTNLKILNLTGALYKSGFEEVFTKLPPKIFSPLGCLESLLLQFNELEKLDENDFRGLGNLKKLDISGNPIKATSCQLFKYLINLTDLYFDMYYMEQVYITLFDDLAHLKHLSIGDYRCSLPIGMFSKLVDLETLDLRGFEVLPIDKIKVLSNLKRLDISNCTITQLEPEAFADLNKLEAIGLYGENISSLDISNFKQVLQHIEIMT